MKTKQIITGTMLGLAVCAAPVAWAGGTAFDLGSAGGWAILELGNGTVGSDTHINNPSPPAIADGNVGIVGYVNNGNPAGGTFNSSGPDVTGGLYVGTGASYSLSGGAQIQGGVTQNYAPLTGPTTNPGCAPVYNDALAAYSFAKGLSGSAHAEALRKVIRGQCIVINRGTSGICRW